MQTPPHDLSPAVRRGLRRLAPLTLGAMLVACGGGSSPQVAWNANADGSALGAVSAPATPGSGTGTGSGSGAGSGTGADTGSGTGTDSGSGTGAGTGSGTGSGTGTDTGSGTGTGTGSSTPTSGCSSGTYLFCEDFESSASAAASSANWNIDTTGTASIDATHARGNKALHLHTTDNGRAFLLPKSFAPPGNSFFGRMWIWVDAFPTQPDFAHFTMVEALGTGNNTLVRPIGGQYIPGMGNGNALWGVGSDGGPTGDWTNWKPSAPTSGAKWTCMEWQMDAADNSVKVWIDGVAQPDLSVSTTNHGGTNENFVFPVFNQIKLGWQLYQSGATPGQFDVWLDDVALSSERINCGASSDAGSGSGSGSGTDTTTPPTTPVACSGMTLCDDFEAPAAGSGPDSSRWSFVSPNCSDNTGKAVIDDTVFHSGGKSIRIDSGANYCGHTFIYNNLVASMGNTVYGRFYIRLKEALGDPHVTFMAMCDGTDSAADSGTCNVSTVNNALLQTQNVRDVRLGGQSGIVDWNRQRSDPTVPALSPAGKALSTALTPNVWHCIEFGIDQSAGTLQTWIDGTSIPGLQIDATPTPDVDASWLTNAWHPALKDFKLGWEAYSGAGTTVWYDDVALHTSRIGCSTP